MRFPIVVAGLAALLASAAPSALEFKPKAEAEARWFFQYEPEDKPVLGAAAATVELYHGWQDGKQRIVGELFQRYDENDDARTHGDVRELYYQVIGDDFEFRLGARRVFWGVTESRHLVDVINQSDFVENIDNEDKLGQPMMNVALIRELGTFELFLLPYQRARTFPGVEGFPRLPLPVHAHEARYESDQEQTHLDGALRYTGSFGPLDLGVAYFDGTAREPRLLLCLQRGATDANGDPYPGTADQANCDPDSAIPDDPTPAQIAPFLAALGIGATPEQVAAFVSNLVLVPMYDRLQQGSVDAQYVIGNLALKVEALRREQNGDGTWAAVTGFEYTLGDVQGSGADIGLIAEYLFDEKDDFLGQLADDELFFGSRIALNDVAGTQFLGGAIASRKDFGNRLYGVEASRRLGDDWKVSLESRLFSAMPDDLVGNTLSNQDFAMLTLERFF
jgi:hypothetical protein